MRQCEHSHTAKENNSELAIKIAFSGKAINDIAKICNINDTESLTKVFEDAFRILKWYYQCKRESIEIVAIKDGRILHFEFDI